LSVFIIIQVAAAQDELVLENQEISSTETYEAANSITAGPGFTILSTGNVTFKAGNYIYLRPGFTILSGGTFHAMLHETYGPVIPDMSEIPEEFKLGQNYPNPFNPSTTIEFTLPKPGYVRLEVYTVTGERISTLISDNLHAGKYTYEIDGQNLSSGLYIYRLTTDSYQQSRKMILMK
jgi:hypothetical protein